MPAADHSPDVLPVNASVRLRRFDPDHADSALLAELLQWYRDLDTVRLLEGPGAEAYDSERLLRMFRHLRDHGELYLIERQDDRAGWQPIGDVTLQPTAIPIMLCRAARNQGIGRAVITTMITRARDLGWPAVRVSDIYRDNEPSRRLFESLGFVPGEETELGRRYTLRLR
ncbi:GNAT family N-acetyltransferase [Microlunatus speluncae]|uniref:GNAT family N-acetyltransferase n=1 Tax=Microlunatus speluncae TaxID=2594267 RepID=UPI001375CF50|nr:GNAT family N-acetyltransferase [Microlunatus speluncae]